MLHFEISFVSPPLPPHPTELILSFFLFHKFSTGLGFVCFVVIKTCMLSANRVDFGLFYFPRFTPPPPPRPANTAPTTPMQNGPGCPSAKNAPLEPRELVGGGGLLNIILLASNTINVLRYWGNRHCQSHLRKLFSRLLRPG